MINIKAAIYARYSSDNQKTESIDAQVRFLREFAEGKYTIVNIYIDEALTGTNDNRPQFLQMVGDSKLRLFDVVLVHKLDRFARSRYDSSFYKKELEKQGVKVVSALENFDDSPESIILESVIEGMNEYYSANLSREVKKGMKENALKCKHNGGIPPLGYDLTEDKYYKINEYEAEIVRTIFDMYLGGNGYGKIVKALENYKTKRNMTFSKRSLEAILNNEKYTGTYTFGRFKQTIVDGKRIDVPNDKMIRIENGIPSIITKDEFERVKEKMVINKTEFRKYNKKEDYLLSGKIFCSCGSPMDGNSRHSGRDKKLYVSYDCAARKRQKTCKQKGINRDLIETMVKDKIEEEIMQNVDKIVERVYLYQLNKKDGQNERIRSLNVELKEVKAQIDNIISAITNGMFHESLKLKLSELEEKKENYIIMLGKISTESFANKENIRAFLLVHANIKEKPFDNQESTIDTFLSCVTITHDEAKIDLIVDVAHGGEGYCFTSTIDLSGYRH